jgi:tRNA1(Val) A37 N6-methylase TrmN6
MLSDLKELLTDYAPSILSFIDELLIKRNRDIFVPHWLSDLMFDLSVTNPKSKVINLFSRDGSILTSARLHCFSKLSLYSSEEHLLVWSRLRARLMGLTDTNIYYVPGLQLGKFPDESDANAVIMAPPFNVHVENSNYTKLGSKKKLDSTFCYIVNSLRILAPGGLLAIVVPDGFLFNQASKSLRKELQRYGTVEAVVSLPNETFSSYANVASSILLVRNSISHQEDSQVFFGIIPSNISDNIRNEIVKVIKGNYSKFQTEKGFKESPESFIVNKLESSNWHHSKYHYLKFSELEANVSQQFNLVPLKELIIGAYKGASFVKTDDGDIPYVNPANVREMSLNSDSLLFTSEAKIKSKFRPLELGDIVVNAISNYRGCAAIVDDPDFVGLGANRHIIIIRPDTKMINSFYLAVIINSEHVRKQLFDLTTGAVIPSITLNTIEDLQIPVPSVNLQNEIASSYKSKKLELNKALSRAREIEVEIKDFVSNLGK